MSRRAWEAHKHWWMRTAKAAYRDVALRCDFPGTATQLRAPQLSQVGRYAHGYMLHVRICVIYIAAGPSIHGTDTSQDHTTCRTLAPASTSGSQRDALRFQTVTV